MNEKIIHRLCLHVILLCCVQLTPMNCGSNLADGKRSSRHESHDNLHSPNSSVSWPNTESISKNTDSSTATTLFSADQISAFDRDGFLVVSGLLDDHLKEFFKAGHSYVAESKKLKAYFSSLEMGMIFDGGKSNDPEIARVFRRVALESLLPQAAAELMQLPPDQNVRVLRDVFMSKSVDQDSGCDWHVDDQGFWPESFISENDGVNAWIAMEDMPAEYQGSMVLSPGSHHADEWRFEAYAGIGQNHSSHGGFTKEEMKLRADSGEKLFTTCELRTQAPGIREKIEQTKFVPDVKKGDVIFATRLLFHRTASVTDEGKKYYAKNGIEYLNRYSIRYVPGTARLPLGWNFEWSIVTNTKNEGKTLDAAMESDNHLWYPRAWPQAEEDFDSKLDVVADGLLDKAKAMARSEFFSLIGLFSKTMNG